MKKTEVFTSALSFVQTERVHLSKNLILVKAFILLQYKLKLNLYSYFYRTIILYSFAIVWINFRFTVQIYYFCIVQNNISMASINFLYRSTKEKSNLILRLLYRYNGTDFVLGSKIRIEIEKNYWSKQHKKKSKNIDITN